MVATNLTLAAILAAFVVAVFWLFGEMETGPRARLVVVHPSATQDTADLAGPPALPDRISVGAIPDRPERD